MVCGCVGVGRCDEPCMYDLNVDKRGIIGNVNLMNNSEGVWLGGMECSKHNMMFLCKYFHLSIGMQPHKGE